MLVGAHQSISGGYYKAVELASQSSCVCVQLFTKNNNQWRGKPITDEDAAAFQAKLKELSITHPLSHDSYLINLAAPDDELWEKSIAAMSEELARADRLGIPYVVTHPGSYTSSSESAGLQRIIAAFDRIHNEHDDLRAVTLLECTAGQGTNLGHRLEHLHAIIEGVRDPQRLAVCLDSCHLFAAGYDLRTAAAYEETIDAVERTVGVKQVKAWHLNDSKKGLGSRVDRHEHIGQGAIGLEGFRCLMNDARFADTPKYLETPKGAGGAEGIEFDRQNLNTLRGLVVV